MIIVYKKKTVYSFDKISKYLARYKPKNNFVEQNNYIKCLIIDVAISCNIINSILWASYIITLDNLNKIISNYVAKF